MPASSEYTDKTTIEAWCISSAWVSLGTGTLDVSKFRPESKENQKRGVVVTHRSGATAYRIAEAQARIAL